MTESSTTHEITREEPPVIADDAAWATINTPLDVHELTAFCQDTERLLRINPFYEFKKWKKTGENSYQCSGRNLSHEPAIEFEFELKAEKIPDGVQLNYTGGLKTSTIFKIEPAEQGSRLSIIDDYSGIAEEERRQRIDEVDKSLVTWASDLQRYLITWKKWSWLAPWCFYMRRIWQPMKPMGRRVTYILLWISVVEVALLALGAMIYWSEYM